MKQKKRHSSIQHRHSKRTTLCSSSINMERRTSRTSVKNIPPEIEGNWLIAATRRLNLEEQIKILEAEVTEQINWTEKSLKILIQSETLILDEIPEIVQVGETQFVIFCGRPQTTLFWLAAAK